MSKCGCCGCDHVVGATLFFPGGDHVQEEEGQEAVDFLGHRCVIKRAGTGFVVVIDGDRRIFTGSYKPSLRDIPGIVTRMA